MTQHRRPLAIFFASLAATAVLAGGGNAAAWWARTIHSSACRDYAPVHECPYVSDTAMPGNSASAIYADFYVPDDVTNAHLSISACAEAFNGLGGSCGAANNAVWGGGFHEVSLAKWHGTGSQYDYFWVSFVQYDAQVSWWVVGIGVFGV